MDSDDEDPDMGGASRKPRATREVHRAGASSEKPYRVGKGKPPVEHQFRKGQPSPNPRGRPRGSTRANSLEKLLGKVVMASTPDGRSVRKTLGEVIDHKLVEMAAGGDLKAIALVKDLELRLWRLGLIGQPSAEERAREAADQEQRKALSAELVRLLEEEACRKKEKAPRYRPKKSVETDPDEDPGAT